MVCLYRKINCTDVIFYYNLNHAVTLREFYCFSKMFFTGSLRTDRFYSGILDLSGVVKLFDEYVL